MVLGEKIESVVKLERLYFESIQFQRSADNILSNNLTLQFTRSYDFNTDHTNCMVKLGCHIKDPEKKRIGLDVTICGVFACSDEPLARRDELLKKNTLAILFPYLRSQVSLVTTQPGLAPIVLPPVNIESVCSSSEE